eukprot:CAMPEP_0172872146 /NCGR_PEP_ID=MMETSP1075-20121228/92479_1 /TAXON_ID=2916 /ORGANISM="Ceratium fusus, Strain PA161109" /LENGTH=179 /DNA_ID=CAMNT_0013722455 /DNA_START=60 /DNA_END=602 /DNA_ORIENTATION=+
MVKSTPALLLLRLPQRALFAWFFTALVTQTLLPSALGAICESWNESAVCNVSNDGGCACNWTAGEEGSTCQKTDMCSGVGMTGIVVEERSTTSVVGERSTTSSDAPPQSTSAIQVAGHSRPGAYSTSAMELVKHNTSSAHGQGNMTRPRPSLIGSASWAAVNSVIRWAWTIFWLVAAYF